MPRHPRKSQYRNTQKQIIFLLRSPKSKEFFVGHCQPDSLMPIFRQHWAGDRIYTDKCFLELKKEELHPCLAVLEEIYATNVEAYRSVIAWTKIFVDAGFKNLNTGNIEYYMQDMFGDTLVAYEMNKDADLAKICDCSSCLVSRYGRKNCPMCTCEVPEKVERPKGKTPKNVQLHIRMSEEELKQIEQNAKICDKTVSAYVRCMAKKMCVLPLDYDCVTEHTHELSVIGNAIHRVAFTICKSGSYTPVDLRYMVERINEIQKSENQFLNAYNKCVERNEKLLNKYVRQTVKELARGTVDKE